MAAVVSIKHRDDIDGLRAIAILGVIGFHLFARQIGSGFTGVDVFFVISGYLITDVISRQLATDNFRFIEFYRRRILRLFPALILVMSATLAAGWLILSAHELVSLGSELTAGTTFSSNFLLAGETGYFDLSPEQKPLRMLWSLAVEEQFYLVWPVLLVLASRLRANPMLMAVLIVCASFYACIATEFGTTSAAYFNTGLRCWEIGLGAITYFGLQREQRVSFMPAAFYDLLPVMGLALIVAGLCLISTSASYPGWSALVPTVGCAAIVASRRPSVVTDLLASKILMRIGKISYPLYLWHWPILSFARIVTGTELSLVGKLICIFASAVLATLTYLLLERPCQKSRKDSVPLLLCIGLISLGAFGVALVTGEGFPARSWIQMQNAQAGEINGAGTAEYLAAIERQDYPCTHVESNVRTPGWIKRTRCLESKLADNPDVALIGDSHAEHLFLGLAEAAPTRDIALYYQQDLPTLDAPAFRNAYSYVLSTPSVGTVILSAYWTEKLSHPEDEQRLEGELDATLAALSQAGKEVFLVEDTPIFSFDPARCKYRRTLIAPRCSENSKAQMTAQAADNLVLERIVGRYANAHVIPVSQAFCDTKVCRMAAGGSIFFLDRHHLNAQGSRYLAKRMVSEFPAMVGR